ncbi:MAG: hypothetical protein ABSH46_20245 [Bryobacteraceae bacterium]|jgi:hypothetical protein
MIPAIVVALLLATHAAPRYAAGGGEPEVYASIPAEERAGFRAALEKVLELEREGKWDEVYEWHDKEEPFGGKANVSRTTFVRKVRGNRPLDFVVTGVYYIPPERIWSVVGCARFSRMPPFVGRQSGGVVASFHARRTVDGWRFGVPPNIRVDMDAGGVQGCAITPPGPEPVTHPN